MNHDDKVDAIHALLDDSTNFLTTDEMDQITESMYGFLFQVIIDIKGSKIVNRYASDRDDVIEEIRIFVHESVEVFMDGVTESIATSISDHMSEFVRAQLDRMEKNND